jgi:DNA polymerase III delta subunit
MILVFYGPDDYRRLQKIRAILAEFKKKHPQGAYARFDCGTAEERERFKEFAHTRSMFEPAKLSLLHGVGESGAKELARELKELAEQRELTIVIVERKKPESPFAFLVPGVAKTRTKQPIEAQKFDFLEGAAWDAFALQEARARGTTLSPGAVRLLAEVYARDTWRLVTELDKLAGLSGQMVTEHDLGALGLETTPEFWGVVNGLKNPAASRRLEALEKLFAQKEPAQKIFHMIAYQWPEKLEAFAAYDRGVKSGKLDYEEALTDLAAG